MDGLSPDLTMESLQTDQTSRRESYFERPASVPGQAEPLIRIWHGALLWFVVAAATGAWYRFVMAGEEAFGFSLNNVRHAHSHLMYFGWVTPAAMALMSRRIWEHLSGRERTWMRRVLAALLVASGAVFPSFLLLGYGSMVIGAASLPVSVMLSGVHMLLWYAFAVLLMRGTGRMRATRARLLFRWATVFLVASTLGAWSLALLRPLGLHGELLSSALTHLFLDLFSEGWLVLAVIGLAYHDRYGEGVRPFDWSLGLILVGVIPLFLLSLPSGSPLDVFRLAAHLGAVFAGVGLLVNAAILWRSPQRTRRAGWQLVLPFLALKAVMLLTIGLLPGLNLAAHVGLRILYLHVLLLGFVSIGLMAAARSTFGTQHAAGLGRFVAGVVVLLLSLLPMTPLFPPAWRGSWMLPLAAWTALGPLAIAVWMILRSLSAPSVPTASSTLPTGFR